MEVIRDYLTRQIALTVTHSFSPNTPWAAAANYEQDEARCCTRCSEKPLQKRVPSHCSVRKPGRTSPRGVGRTSHSFTGVTIATS